MERGTWNMELGTLTVSGTIIDLFERRHFTGHVHIVGDRIADIVEDSSVVPSQVILPGFVDAHVHVESSMLVPSEFARLVVVHGTVATVSDPHEIGNVCGVDGVRYMMENGERVPFTFAFGAPSCVPATTFETAGAEITVSDIQQLFEDPRIRYLSEMMNWPGVLHDDPIVIAKIAAAHAAKRPVDGHAPGLKGADAAAYASHGISTDHECFTLEEALDKISAGMKILIREGSAARNFDALHSLLASHPERVMFCCDDVHPDMLVAGHINMHVRRALAHGYNVYDVLRAACVHPVEHYSLPVGMLRKGDPADFIIVNDLDEMSVLETWVRGTKVAERGVSLISRVSSTAINQFKCESITEHDIAVDVGESVVRVIVAHDGQLVTTEEHLKHTDTDVLKIVVVNRYSPSAPAVAYVKGFGLKQGALASTVAHDSHNIIAVGCSDNDIASAINAVIAKQGGIGVCDGNTTHVLPLPVAGLMSLDDGYAVAREYERLTSITKELGSPLRAPFMTLSFMALLVIPQLKLSDKGLFDGTLFTFVPLKYTPSHYATLRNTTPH